MPHPTVPSFAAGRTYNFAVRLCAGCTRSSSAAPVRAQKIVHGPPSPGPMQCGSKSKQHLKRKPHLSRISTPQVPCGSSCPSCCIAHSFWSSCFAQLAVKASSSTSSRSPPVEDEQVTSVLRRQLPLLLHCAQLLVQLLRKAVAQHSSRLGAWRVTRLGRSAGSVPVKRFFGA